MNVTKGPGDLPPFEPDDSIWDDEEWVYDKLTELRKEWIDKAQELLLEYVYSGSDGPDRTLRELAERMTMLIEERAEASRYPPD